jgi:hypothetical protein
VKNQLSGKKPGAQKPLAKLKEECMQCQGYARGTAFADNFAASAHNNSQVLFHQSSFKSTANSLSWTILQITPLF